MKARITITLRSGILDPQGQAIAHALNGLGFDGVVDARQGKVIELKLSDTVNADEAKAQLESMCQQLLANPVMEDYRVEMVA
jgi:phosphoribosylformylglycinamidine synthase PurS subunit